MTDHTKPSLPTPAADAPTPSAATPLVAQAAGVAPCPWKPCLHAMCAEFGPADCRLAAECRVNDHCDDMRDEGAL